MIYIDSDVIAECREAIRQNVPIAAIAGKLGVTVAELRLVLGLPTLVEAKTVNVECDLWRVVEAEGQL